jgi:hypothetical protein
MRGIPLALLTGSVSFLGAYPGGPSWNIPFVAPNLASPTMEGLVTLLQCVIFDGSNALLEGTTSFRAARLVPALSRSRRG